MYKMIQKTNIKLDLLFFIKAIFWSTILGGIFIKAFYFQFTSKINALPFTDGLNRYMYIGTMGSLLLFLPIFLLLFNKKRYLGFILIHFVLTFLILADTIYFRYYYHPLSVTVFYQIGVVDSIGGSTLSLFKLKDFVFALDIPILICSYLYIRNKGIERFHIAKRAIAAVLLIAVGAVLFAASYSKAYKPSFTIDNNYVCKYLGVMYYHYYDARNFVKETFLEDHDLSSEEKKRIDNYFTSKKESGNKFNGIAKGKNLIVIQTEALQEFVINRTINGKEITPNLNQLIKESAYFNNIYYQIGDGNTSDAEFLTNASLYPIKHGSVNFRYAGNTFSALPGLLRKQGYDTLAFHANRPSFWNRSIMFNSLGFRELHGNPSFTLDEKVGWGLSDSSFFKQSLSMIDTSKPFYSLMITLSSHFPYNFDYSSRSTLDVGKYKDSLLGRYLNAQNYVDSCFGDFIKDLKDKGLYDNSLIVIYGDHYGIPKEEAKDLVEFLNIENSDFEWTKLQKVPLIIHYPGVENGKVHTTVGGELDIMPTIANLMALDSTYAIGKDLFNTDYGYALLRNGSLVTDKYLYIQNQSKAYDLENGSILSDDIYMNELKKYLDEYEISQLIVEKNALKK